MNRCEPRIIDPQLHASLPADCGEQVRATRTLARRRRAWKLASLGSFPHRPSWFACVWLLADSPSAHAAAGYKTTNFAVSAPTPQLAKEIGDAAEVWRRQLVDRVARPGAAAVVEAVPDPRASRAELGAGGATSFVFDRGEVFGWKMNIQGSRERILDSVLPHEVTHTIFASYFRQPLPRWADEGACTTVEHRSEIAKQERNADRVPEDGPRHSVQPDVRDEGVSAAT